MARGNRPLKIVAGLRWRLAFAPFVPPPIRVACVDAEWRKDENDGRRRSIDQRIQHVAAVHTQHGAALERETHFGVWNRRVRAIGDGSGDGHALWRRLLLRYDYRGDNKESTEQR